LNTDQIYQKSFSRNLGLINPEEQQILRNSRIAIPGMGGVGGVHAVTLARTGLGRFKLADFDEFDYANFNRQYGAFQSTVGKSKVEVMEKFIKDINPSADIIAYEQGINESNIDDFLKDVDVVVDSLDVFVPQTRRLLFNKAREKGIYVVTAAPLGFSVLSTIHSPHGKSIDKACGLKDGMSDDEVLARMLAGATKGTHTQYMDFRKINVETGVAPSLGLACQLVSGVVAAEVVNILLKKRPIVAYPWAFQFDPYVHKYKKILNWIGPKNPLFKIRLVMIRKILAKKK